MPTRSLPPGLEPSRVLNCRQAAELLNFSVVHFRRLYKTNRTPPAMRIGARKLGWRAGDLTSWLEKRALGGSDDTAA